MAGPERGKHGVRGRDVATCGQGHCRLPNNRMPPPPSAVTAFAHGGERRTAEGAGGRERWAESKAKD